MYDITYDTIAPYRGQYANLRLWDGHEMHGQIVEVRHEGVLFHSSNPGFLFLPFAAITAFALTAPLAFGLGYAFGSRPYRPYYY
ncbi:hypothetical protein Sgly_2819 [Syntrophobotulus glycolicus DSM 8271]|uniref:Uncharacterized protein n=1 Tax=Syntrophobotulus glycolicus (strain DSM 8271 / FlGlyR) TaxID=645991 RepID=F0SYH7_SYNGF|nr:hypothetical protein [Syntrophobotulus glycolicus]ADY57089.1 hypothetical protein Sgly_2819 [Syntrophobotulus glycolicus DSM 8271]